MFLGYQNGKITFVAKNREELENMPCVSFEKIEETEEIYSMFEGEYMLQSVVNLLEKEAKCVSIRTKRDKLLCDTDRKMLLDYPIDEHMREKYKGYRQYLRDIPLMDDFPNLEILSFEEWAEK